MPPSKGKKAKSNPILDDFRNFLFLVWQHLKLPPPTKAQYEIADYLQHGPSRQIIMAFRGVGKSWITSAFVLWSLLRNPQDKFLVVSASKTRADDFSTFTLQLIKEMPILQHLKPTEEQRCSRISFDVGPSLAAHAPSVKSVGIYGQLTGGRANHVIADDVEVPNNSGTEDMREKLIKTVGEFEAIISPDARITFLGTPQTEESIYQKLRQRGYDCRIWPARYPKEEKIDSYLGGLADSITQALKDGSAVAGEPVDPKRFTDADLLTREEKMGRTAFTLQFMLDTSLSDRERYPLRLSDLIIMDLDTEKAPTFIQYGSGVELQWKELKNVGFSGDRFHKPMFVDKDWQTYEGSVMSIDPSGRGQDETGFAVVKQLHGKLFVLEAGGLKGGYEENTLEQLALIGKRHKVNAVIIESNFGDGMFTKLFTAACKRVGYPCSIEEVRHSIQKEKRICDTLEPVMCSHRLVVNKSIAEREQEHLQNQIAYSLFYQLTRVTRERGALRHDDRLDALAMAVGYWVKSMGKLEEEARDHYKAEQMADELKAFMDNALLQHTNGCGLSPTGRSGKGLKWTRARC